MALYISMYHDLEFRGLHGTSDLTMHTALASYMYGFVPHAATTSSNFTNFPPKMSNALP